MDRYRRGQADADQEVKPAITDFRELRALIGRALKDSKAMQ
jgi:hypothetical protein